jgi:RNA polymerase sigma factor (sigma-70 family)
LFPTTRWSAILGARSADEPERVRSWSALLAAYWRPAYKHVRIRWKKPREDAEDLIQSFFERAMEKDFFASYDPETARFRTFLKVCVDRFVMNEVKAAGRQKRGGGAELLSFDFETAEREISLAAEGSPDDLFDREWRRTLFTLAVEALRAHCEEKGKLACFTAFERYDLAEHERPTYDALGRELGIPATTVTNHLAYARRELRRLVLVKLEEITATHEEYRDEAKALLGVDVG